MNKQSGNSRRKFIINSALGTASLSIGMSGLASFVPAETNAQATTKPAFATGFDQQPLPYGYTALEDVIDAKTMEIHYTKHHETYVKNLNAAIEKYHEAEQKQDVASMIAINTSN